VESRSTETAQTAARKGVVSRLKAIGAVRTFSSFGRFSKITLALMFLAGWIALAIFWATDVGVDIGIGPWDVQRPNWIKAYDQTWMHTHAYVPNILAGFTGFLIGAPVAAVILAGFTNEREENAARQRINRLSALAWDSFRKLVNEFASEGRYELIVNQARDIETCYEETTQAIDEYGRSANELLGSPDAVKLNNNMKQLKDIEPRFRTAVNALRQNINFFETQDEWAQIVGAWRVLDQYVRLQRLEQGLEWFDQQADSGFRKWTSRESNPLQDLLDAIEVRLYTPNMTLNVDTMANALDTLTAYTRMDSAANLGEYVLNYGNSFTPERSSVYHAKRDAAQLFILDLKRYISLVEMTYWPRRQTSPKEEDVRYEPTMTETFGSLSTPEGEKELKAAFKRIIRQRNREKRKRMLRRVLWGVQAGPEPKRDGSSEKRSIAPQ
jgi:hypothetical protein